MKRMKHCLLLAILLAAMVPLCAQLHRDSLKAITLSTTKGKKQHITFQPGKLTAFVWLSPECPLSQNYTKPLNDIQKEFASDLTITGIVPGKSYSSKEIRRYAKDYNIAFSLLTDNNMQLTTMLHATTTPEVVLVNDNGTILYRGAIDDWAVSLGKKKTVATNTYLKNAIAQALGGNEIVIRTTKPVGCLINDF